VEGDFSGANIEGSGECSNSLGFFSAIGNDNAGCRAKMTWFGTAAARLGVTVDRALVFIKAGGAGAHFDESVTANLTGGAGGPFAPGAPNSFTSSHSGNRGGFTVGTGIEYALGSNLSAKVEYDYMDFGTNNLTYVFGGPGLFGNTVNLGVEEHQRVHLVKAGLNYRFNWR
jgi:outer membrane immunogenic protein